MYPFLERALQRTDTTTFLIVNDILAATTIVTIIVVVLETVEVLQPYTTWFVVIEWVAVTIFIFEYIARLFVNRPAWRYVVSFYGLVDLVAIAPSLLGIGNAAFLKSARALRIIRLLRIVRLAKIARLTMRSSNTVTSSPILFQVGIYAATLVSALLFSGALMYAVEPQTTAYADMPRSMWWSFKVFLGGFIITDPVTFMGEVGYVIIRFIGLLLLGLLIGMVGNVFRTLLFPDQRPVSGWREE